MPAPIDRCPAEVLIGFVEASEHGDRRTLRTINKEWKSLATSLAFESLVLKNTRKSVANMLLLLRNRLAKWAKTLEYRLIDRSPVASANAGLIQVGQQDQVAKTIYQIISELGSLFPLLESFHVCLFAGPYNDPLHIPVSPDDVSNGVSKYVMHHFNILDALSTIGETPPRHLKTLSLHNLLPCPEPSMMEENFKRLMEPLEDLTLSVHRARSLDNQDYWEVFWQEYLPDYVLAPAQSLTSLSMTSDQPVGSVWPGIDFSVLHFPALRRLKLGGFCFDTSSHLEDFIIKHQNTLTSLVLDSCPMHTGDDFQNKTPRRKWSQVFARFDEGLTELTYVRVMCKDLPVWGLYLEDSPRTEMALTYEISTTGYGYIRGEPVAAAVEKDDDRALEKFYATVDARRRSKGLGPLASLATARANEGDGLPRPDELPQLLEMIMSSLAARSLHL
ncbi:uncharacterized protein B0H18DRAFT_1058557 [Fomitopsis serialis]|uniref:uncharacterized protein n=1 Tax=Fomitopsis serialis TaxID=139415 RepID=UPI002007325C|nr:uncharacterized protein B0H18DRAFT_1058557 [Neoantrodia serialis]KAH9911834.1 hypothetical protein B0H18DRAFT_1058557 [Neoantrodia serialis]